MSDENEFNDFDKEKFEEAFKKAYDEKAAEFESLSKEKLIISLVGGVNVGKSKTINALTGIKYASVKARAGWTKNISLYELKEGVFIADTPGLYDIDENVSNKTQDFIQSDCDIILFFLNATVGITKFEKESLLNISTYGKELIVVLNKIDALEEEELVEVEQQIFEETNFKPISISAKENKNIQELSDKILSILEEKGKELLFLKVSKYKEKKISNWINGATVTAAGIGAIPIPGSDIVPLTALQVGLAMKIAFIWDCKITKGDVMQLVGATVTGSIGKQIARWSITALKAAGWIPGGQLLEVAIAGIAATVAASLTYGFGWACNAYYKSGMTMDLGEVGETFKKYYEEYKKKKDSK
jgi:GTP-binding protein Era